MAGGDAVRPSGRRADGGGGRPRRDSWRLVSMPLRGWEEAVRLELSAEVPVDSADVTSAANSSSSAIRLKGSHCLRRAKLLLGQQVAMGAVGRCLIVRLMPRALVPRTLDVPEFVGLEVAQEDTMGRVGSSFLEAPEAAPDGCQEAGVLGQFAAGLGAVLHQPWGVGQGKAGTPKHRLAWPFPGCHGAGGMGAVVSRPTPYRDSPKAVPLTSGSSEASMCLPRSTMRLPMAVSPQNQRCNSSSPALGRCSMRAS